MIIEDSVLVSVENSDINEDGSFDFPEGVTSIGEGAFEYCSNLINITIPKGVTSIEDNAFSSCRNLTNIVIPEGVTSIGNGAFSYCSSLTNITIPEGVTSIGYDAFKYCNSLTNITIPEGVTSIGEMAFYDCSSLMNITIPKGVTSIGESVFLGCRSLTNIVIPEGVRFIGASAFSGCSNLMNIVIPEGVTSIKNQTFSSCRNLTNIVIPKGVTSIGGMAFYDCSSLMNITIPEGVRRIGESAFEYCRSLTNITIPEGVTCIGENAFKYCGSLTNITIPKSVTRVGRYAFPDCSKDLIFKLLSQNINVINGLGEREVNDLTFLSSIIKDYSKLNIGRILKAVIDQKVEDKYKKLEELENLVRENEKGKIRDLIWESKKVLNLDEDLSNQIDEQTQRLQKWIDKGFIPMKSLYNKISLDKLDKFDKKIWFTLAKEPVFNISEETKMALAELVYAFGVFDKDKVEIRGNGRNIEDLTKEEKRNGVFEDYQKRVRSILELVHSGKLTNENLHTMFDGTDMKFKPMFYRFFMDNIDEIFADSELMEKMPSIQREMDKIVQKFRGRIPTPKECMRYFADITYENIENGNEKLAELCKLCGLTQGLFDEYQMLHNEQKERRESTIPQVKGKNYEILELDDPKTLLIGEGEFSKCCQRLGGAGESCMRHSGLSENGRIIEIFDDGGTLIAQSWMWRNGNAVCFDSIEANAIDSGKYSEAEQKKLMDKIEQAYRDASKELIEKSEEQVEIFRKKKIEEIEKLEDKDKEHAIQVLEEVCEGSKIKMVTCGRGYWPISQKITSRFSNNPLTGPRISPREDIDYLNDSDTQYIIAQSDKKENIKTNESKVEVKYRDERVIKAEKGLDIDMATLEKIKRIEQEAHKDSMQLMQSVTSIEDISNIYETSIENLRIISGKDWYLIYSEEKNRIHVHDLARAKTKFEDEELKASKEILKGIDKLLEESIEKGKEISAELREDTSYLLLLRMKERGLIEQIGEDTVFEFNKNQVGYDDYNDDDYNEGYDDDYDNTAPNSQERTITEEEQKAILKRSKEIREEGAKTEKTLMHRLKFKPTEKYKKRLESKKNKNEQGVEV